MKVTNHKSSKEVTLNRLSNKEQWLIIEALISHQRNLKFDDKAWWDLQSMIETLLKANQKQLCF